MTRKAIRQADMSYSLPRPIPVGKPDRDRSLACQVHPVSARRSCVSMNHRSGEVSAPRHGFRACLLHASPCPLEDRIDIDS